VSAQIGVDCYPSLTYTQPAVDFWNYTTGCSLANCSSNHAHGHWKISNPLIGNRTWRLSGRSAPGPRRRSQRISRCTSSNGPLAWRLRACGQVFLLSTPKRTTYNVNLGLTTSLIPHSSRLSCSNTNSRKYALSLHSLHGVIQSRRVGSSSIKHLTTHSGSPSTDASSRWPCIRPHTVQMR